MAILPTDPFALDGNIILQGEPGRTWYIDKTTNRINGEVDNLAAVRQAVEIILNVDRYRYWIYRPSSGMDYRNLVGQDAGYVAMEVQRRVIDALSMDTRFLGIENYTFTFSGDVLDISFLVRTVYGNFEQKLEVPLV